MTSPRLSSRALSTPDSPMRRIARFADEARARGTRVYHLNIGDPDTEAPPQFLERVRTYEAKLIPYEPARGSVSLRESWSRYFNKATGLNSGPDNFIITNGGSESLLFAMLVAADPGEEILVLDPVYANYLGIASMGAVRLKAIPTTLEGGFVPPTVESIRAAITEKTRALLLCNPDNPTGAVLSKELLIGAVKLCEERGLILIVDETYREMVYDGVKPVSVLELAPGSAHVIVVDSFSKRFSLCGARIGCFLSFNPDLVSAAYKMASSRLAISSIDQSAAAHLLDSVNPNFISKMRAEYETRRNTLCRALEKIPGVAFHRPQGTFYLIARIPVRSSEEFALFMLRDFSYHGATTFVTPARGFYVTPGLGLDEVRIAFVLRSDDLVHAIETLGKGIEAFN